MPKTDFLENLVLTNLLSLNPYVGLSSTTPSDAGGNITEPSGGGYARASTAGKWGTVASGQVSNNADIDLASTGTWGARLTHFVLFDAATTGNALRYDWLGREAYKYFQPLNANVTNNRITITAHGYTSGNEIVTYTPDGSTLATGLSNNTRYYVSVIDANTIELYTDSALTTYTNV